jgi:signal transduction histidine kinase
MSLAICKRIVEAHGGKIAIESAVEKGTTITITLPIKLARNDFPQVQMFNRIEMKQSEFV